MRFDHPQPFVHATRNFRENICGVSVIELVAEGTARIAAKRSNLTEYSVATTSGRDHAAALSSALASFGKLVRRAIDASNEFNDADTADIFTEISRGLDKWLWMVEAHLQERV